MSKINKETMLDRAKRLRPEYTYDKFNFINSKTKVIITCPIHGDFKMLAHNLFKGTRCPTCGQLSRNKKRTSNTEEFIKKSKAIHKDKYDYGETKYIRSNKKVKIYCNKCEEFFEITPNDHLSGKGHSVRCSLGNTNETFIKKAKDIHGNKYTYDKVNYINNNTKVIITCPKHGDFETLPRIITQGSGCPKCGIEKRAQSNSYTREDFINKAVSRFGDTYDYSKVVYKSSKDKVEIICSEHGSFFQEPSQHLVYKIGCPECGAIALISSKESKQELEVFDYVKKIYDEEVIQHQRFYEDDKYKYELDIFIPDKNIGIEYNGSYWHSSLYVDKNYHVDKAKWFTDKGIKILQIWEHYYNEDNKKEIYEHIIKDMLDLNNKIENKDIYIEKLLESNKEIKNFINRYSLYGWIRSDVYYLIKNKETDEMLQTYSFSFKKDNNIKLNNITTKTGINIPNSFEIIINKIRKKNNINKLIYNIDNDTNRYIDLDKYGFIFDKSINPIAKNLCITAKARNKYNNINGVFNKNNHRDKEIKTDIINEDVALIYGTGKSKYILKF